MESDRYGCHNKPYTPGYWVRDQHISEHRWIQPKDVWKFIADVSPTHTCKYDHQDTDRKCAECVHSRSA